MSTNESDSSDNEEIIQLELTEEEKDQLLYNDQEDNDNEKWVLNNYSSKNKGSTTKINHTYLSCPGCFTLLCVDCQKHDTYKNQYRAMFVKNCDVDFTKRLVYKEQVKKSNNNNSKSKVEEDVKEELIEYYHSVNCSFCQIQVGLFDSEEVYHFFNVIPSIN